MLEFEPLAVDRRGKPRARTRRFEGGGSKISQPLQVVDFGDLAAASADTAVEVCQNR